MTNITIIGAGNMGTHLAKALQSADHKIVQVFSRTTVRARRLADTLDVSYTTKLARIRPDADLYIIAVHDDAIGEVAAQLKGIIPDKLVVHTSGSVPSTVLQPYFERYGSFYPLQTMSIGKSVDFKSLPICTDAAQSDDADFLYQLAQTLTPKVYRITDEQRRILHVAAVFVNNFTNHLYHIAQEMLTQEGLDFDILKPLILETASKIQAASPRDMQTGPAARGDQEVIKKHQAYLEKFPEYREVYALLTKGILGR